MTGHMFCGVEGCTNGTKHQKELGFFRIPVDMPRRKIWAERIGRLDIMLTANPSRCRVCGDHFPPSMFVNKRLRSTALPTLSLPHPITQPEPEEVSEIMEKTMKLPTTSGENSGESSRFQIVFENEGFVFKKVSDGVSSKQENINDSDYSLSDDENHEMQTEENDYKSKTKKRKMVPQGISNQQSLVDDDDFDTDGIDFGDKILKLQKLINKKYKGNINHPDLQLLALNLYVSSPLVYKFLEKIVTLPDVCDIEQKTIQFKPSVSDDAITVLSKRLKSKSFHYKYCMITLTEMELQKMLSYDVDSDDIVGFVEVDGIKHREIASTVLLLSIRGCFEEYTQPLGYAFCSDNKNVVELSIWVCKIIRKLREAHFIVCAVVSHQGSHFTNLAQSIGVNEEKPYFELDGEKVFYVFDALHLIKTLQENLFEYNFLYGGDKLISWEYIEAFYNNDKQEPIRMAPKLTDSHLKPETDDIIYYGSQLLSYSVAAGMSIAIEMGYLPSDAQSTVDFVLKVDQLFDILNSGEDNNPNKFKKPFCGAEYQVKCLTESLEMFKSIVAVPIAANVGVTTSVKSFTGIQTTVNAILQLHNYFVSEGIQSFATKYFRLDASEKFLEQIRNNAGCRKVTAIQFKKSFTELMFHNLFKDAPELDSVALLESFLKSDSAMNANLFFKAEMLDVLTPSLNISIEDFIEDLPIENAITWACGCLLKTCLGAHNCSALSEHADQKHGMDVSAEFLDYVLLFENLFVEQFEIVMLQYAVGEKLLNILEEVALGFEKPCPCFPVKYFISIFLRMRINHVLKGWNRTCIDESNGDVKPIFLKVSVL